MCSEPDVSVSQSQGIWAVRYARDVVETVVETGTKLARPESVDPVFRIERGAFVTLEKNGTLRGCIGRPTPAQPAIEAIRSAAVDAAIEDPRFRSVMAHELPSIRTEVSILTPPTHLEPVVPGAINIGRDGLIVSGRGRNGLLLPQVPVDQGWDTETFLAETCRKAGLPEDSWTDSDVTVKRFSAQIFKEVTPNGTIERRPIDAAEG